MRFLFAAILGAHAVSHLPGFLASWRLATLPELPYRTTALAGRIELGDDGARILGAMWLLVAMAFMTAAAGVAAGTPWALNVTIASAAMSTVLCTAGLPESRIGLAVNVIVPLLLVLAVRLDLVALTN